MRYTVYKSLDKPSSLFGLKGSYFFYAAGGALVGAVLALTIGAITNGLIGMLLFIVLLVIDYAVIMGIQTKYSERERTKWFCSHKLPSFITVPPRRLSSHMKVNFKEETVKH